jgi:hypothetical protein
MYESAALDCESGSRGYDFIHNVGIRYFLKSSNNSQLSNGMKFTFYIDLVEVPRLIIGLS